MSKQSEKLAERNKSIEVLRRMFPRGSTVNVGIRHVSSSGMSRAIVILGTYPTGELANISHLVAKALDYRLHPKYQALKVNGCGMDMGYHVVNSLSMVLYSGDGYALEHRQLF